MDWAVLGTAVAAVLGALGAKEIVDRTLKRRDAREDARDVRSEKLAEAEGNFGIEAMRMAINETKGQIATLRGDVGDLRAKNEMLERQVGDLRRTVEDYQRGLRVPLGMVLIPLAEVREIRERAAGLLRERAYPGEHAELPPAGSVDVRMFPLPPPPPGSN